MTTKLLTLAVLAVSFLPAQNNPVLGEEPVKVSDHVWAIMGWPNVAIVVGSKATLVVDTGLGPANGATVARAAAKLAPANSMLYLVTTHFHPEHAGGDGGFPPNTIIVRNAVQQQEVEESGKEMIDVFAGRNAQFKELLTKATFRTPDIVFDSEAKIDLGGVTVRNLWFGAAHTKGDQLMFVEPDRTLISGDVVQKNMPPNIFRDAGTPASWLAVLDKIAPLQPLHVLPTHSAPGDGSLVAQQKKLITDLQSAALELKKKGVSVEDAGKQLSDRFKMNVAGFVGVVYKQQ
jgi:glyoxylase-like metal-dependent hydrolase (beta-lactamase superfamily II)